MRKLHRAIGCAALALTCAYAGAARARSGGIAALGCDGCHGGGEPVRVSLAAVPSNAAVGQPLTLTITVPQTNGPSAGFYLTTAFPAKGYFGAVGSGTTVDTSGVFHSAPRVGSEGNTVFEAQWTANEATGVTFDVFALSANGDRTNRGDGWGTARLALSVGCVGISYYIDQDDDGYGSDDPVFAPRIECEKPPSYAARRGDCDDFRSDVHPGAPELCDQRDNDCNGEADERVVSQLYCEDRDGDGHGALGRPTKTDCKPTVGFGDCDGDCDDGDVSFHPGAAEICDLRDNDCDGEADEDVRPICGLGLCARRARDCNVETCVPGSPMTETCNGYDDDCDGVVDNGSGAELCGNPGQRCVGGSCIGDVAGIGGVGSAGSGGSVVPTELASSTGSGCEVSMHPKSGGWGAAILLALFARERRRILHRILMRKRRAHAPTVESHDHPPSRST